MHVDGAPGAQGDQRSAKPRERVGSGHRDSVARARAAGRDARRAMPRREQADYTSHRRDVVDILEQQQRTRLPELAPVRIGRMLESPFAFYRGAAAVMAQDLSRAKVTGQIVMACGDAHLANFGFFASPERRLIFDLNDFDEAYPAPWEWDIKRLAASVWLNGRNGSHTEDECRKATQACLRGYRTAFQQLYRGTAADRYYFHVDADLLRTTKAMAGRHIREESTKARRRTSEQALTRLSSRTTDGEPRIIDQPPIMRHPDVMDLALIEHLAGKYRSTLRADTALLISQYRLVDYALRIVGVGSVGTRCWILMFEGPAGEPLFLQAKEAGKSVLETHGGLAQPAGPIADSLVTHGEGSRVVGAHRILQAHSDPFLGWISGVEGPDGHVRDFYIRQFRDMKGSFRLAELDVDESVDYGALCGSMLARAHSQSPGSAFIAGYLGRSDTFDEAVAAWARAYADQTEQDFEHLRQAVLAGRIPAEFGV
ncbi:DUF2252 domain-containing protein [Arthrobacter sp. B0490]|uniref:DUF2252 domain-containing protein n=1 Tax=Arthrobacter sp. B0490 TaxID=2058891 RepID=UPI000CE4C48E|nr:DUF2252 domain-containing protein [Arthrobacter sp. B0490]